MYFTFDNLDQIPYGNPIIFTVASNLSRFKFGQYLYEIQAPIKSTSQVAVLTYVSREYIVINKMSMSDTYTIYYLISKGLSLYAHDMALINYIIDTRIKVGKLWDDIIKGSKSKEKINMLMRSVSSNNIYAYMEIYKACTPEVIHTSLVLAASKDYVQFIQFNRDSLGKYIDLVHVAVTHNSINTVLYLSNLNPRICAAVINETLKYKYDIYLNAFSIGLKNLETVIHEIITKDYLHAFKYIYDLNPDIQYYIHNSDVIGCLCTGKVDIVSFLVSKGSSTCINSSLMYAIINDHIDMVKFMVEKIGCGFTSICKSLACINNSYKVIEYMLERGEYLDPGLLWQLRVI